MGRTVGGFFVWGDGEDIIGAFGGEGDWPPLRLGDELEDDSCWFGTLLAWDKIRRRVSGELVRLVGDRV